MLQHHQPQMCMPMAVERLNMRTRLPLRRKSPRKARKSQRKARKVEGEPIGTQKMKVADLDDQFAEMRIFEEFLRDTDNKAVNDRANTDHKTVTERRFLAELKRRRAVLKELLGRGPGDDDDSFSLDGKLIPCRGNVAFHCMVGYYKESLSICPFCESLWAQLHGQLIAAVRGDADEDEEDVDHKAVKKTHANQQVSRPRRL